MCYKDNSWTWGKKFPKILAILAKSDSYPPPPVFLLSCFVTPALIANHRAFVQRIAAYGTAALPVPLPAVAEQPAQRRHAHFFVARLEFADRLAPAFFSRSIPSSSFSWLSIYS